MTSIYDPHVGGPVQDNPLAILNGLLYAKWACTNPTAATIGLKHFNVTNTRAVMDGLAVTVSRVNRLWNGFSLNMDNWYDLLYVTAFSKDEEGLQVPNMTAEIFRIINAYQNAWCGGIQQMVAFKSIPRDDLNLTPPLVAEAVMVRLFYQGPASTLGQPEPES